MRPLPSGAFRPGHRKKAGILADMRRHYQLYLLILPSLIYFIVFLYIPMYGVQIAFRDYIPSQGFWGSRWVGLDNFRRFFNSYSAGSIIVNTLRLSLMNLALGFPLPILLAIAINEMRGRGYKKLVQTVSYAPYFISTVAIVGMLNIFLSDRGLFNLLIVAFGGKKMDFLTDPAKFSWIYVLSDVWQGMGWGSIIYISALTGIDPNLHEAAVIDGASKLKRILYVDLPGIAPTMVVLLILRTGSIMSVGYEKVFLMQNPLNLSASEVISTYVYKVGLINADYSYSAAIGFFNSAVNLILLVSVNFFARRISENSLW